jgi:hypothetical protein
VDHAGHLRQLQARGGRVARCRSCSEGPQVCLPAFRRFERVDSGTPGPGSSVHEVLVP